MANHSSIKQGFAAGTSIAAGVLLLVVGILQLCQGIAAVMKDDIVIIGTHYTYTWSLTAWGWIHIVVGILVAVTGIALMIGATWARIVAIGIAALSILVNFLWLPHYPGWALAIIALDVVVIWAVATWIPDSV